MLLVATTLFAYKYYQLRQQVKVQSTQQYSAPGVVVVNSSKENNISFTRTQDDKILFLYEGDIYGHKKGYEYLALKLEGLNQSSFIWENLLNFPTKIEILSIFPVEDTEEFLFNISPTEGDVLFSAPFENIYYYNPKENPKLRLLLSSPKYVPGLPPTTFRDNYSHIKFLKMSPTKRYVLVQMYNCRNCGPAYPYTGILELSNGSFDNIGKVSSIKLSDEGGNVYEYTEVKEIPCPNQDDNDSRACYEDPDNLPVLRKIF